MKEPYEIERDRQTQELTTAIDKAIQEFGRATRAAGKAPLLNAVAGAIVTVQGGILASVEDPRIRKALRREMERLLPRAIKEASGRAGETEVIFMGGRTN